MAVPPLFGAYAQLSNGSVRFDGSGDYMYVAANAAFVMTGDFTMEGWMRMSSTAVVEPMFTLGDDPNFGSVGEFVFLFNPSVGLRIYSNAGSIDIQQGGTSGWATDTWYHVAINRTGTAVRLYRNGVAVATGVTGAQIGRSDMPFYMGGDPFQPQSMFGYLSNLRVVTGTGLYPTNFTPPTAPLTAVSGTQLLTAQRSNSIKDASANAFTISTAGNTVAVPLNPF